MKNLSEKARAFAIAAHDTVDHKRKYTGEPYWVHLERVSKIVESVTDDQDIISAAWLHDVLEDVAPHNPNFDAVAIRQEFGDRVLRLVLEVTDVSKPESGNRATRKAIEREHLAQASFEGKLIKLADLIDNITDITKHDPNFARVLRREVILDLPHLASGNKYPLKQPHLQF